MVWTNVFFFSNFQALGTLWDFHQENRFQGFIGRESNWPISCLNDSETQEKGALGVKIQKISQWNAPGPPYRPAPLAHVKEIGLSQYLS